MPRGRESRFPESVIKKEVLDYQAERESVRNREYQTPAVTEQGLYTKETLPRLVAEVTSVLEHAGYSGVALTETDVVTDYHGHVFACEIIAFDDTTETEVKGTITFAVVRDEQYETEGGIWVDGEYRCSLVGNEPIERVSVPPTFAFEWVKKYSESTKVVKSRPIWMYETLLDVPLNELWPEDKKVAVIGDPYQTCDRDNTTIVEYEYADEIVPPYFRHIVGNGEPGAYSRYLENLYHEDIRALDGMYRGLVGDPNPYKLFVEQIVSRIDSFVNEFSTAGLTERQALLDQLGRFRGSVRERCEQFTSGTWSYSEMLTMCHLDSIESFMAAYPFYTAEEVDVEFRRQRETLQTWYDLKEDSKNVESNREGWHTFTDTWERLLGEIELQPDISESIKKKIEQARYYLSILPTATSPARISRGLGYLDGLLNDVYALSDTMVPKGYNTALYDVSMLRDSDFGVFGFVEPGYAVSRRVRQFLEEMVLRVEQQYTYYHELYPKLEEQCDAARNMGITDEATLAQLLRSYEKAFAQAYFFKKRTQRSVPVHGFFPHECQIDPQDRIIALTSVTMHGWNSLNRDGFYDDIHASLPFLTRGGKYILGPINQHAYFSQYPNYDFDTDGLMSALRDLESQGLITFEFRKGFAERRGGYDEYEQSDSDRLKVDEPTVLYPDEAAKSLIITKL